MEEEKTGREKGFENLKPIRDSERAKELGARGGQRSGESKRSKKDAKEAVQYILGLAAQGVTDDELKLMGVDENSRTYMVAVQMAMLRKVIENGDVEAYTKLMAMGGYEPEENRKERESISADRRRDIEVEAKVTALGGRLEDSRITMSLPSEDNNNSDVVIYMPEMDRDDSAERE